MGKIVINYDIQNSKPSFHINNFEVNDVFSIMIYRDITNSYKYTVNIVTDEGLTVIKDGVVTTDNNNDIFIEKFLSYFEGEQK